MLILLTIFVKFIETDTLADWEKKNILKKKRIFYKAAIEHQRGDGDEDERRGATYKGGACLTAWIESGRREKARVYEHFTSCSLCCARASEYRKLYLNCFSRIRPLCIRLWLDSSVTWLHWHRYVTYSFSLLRLRAVFASDSGVYYEGRPLDLPPRAVMRASAVCLAVSAGIRNWNYWYYECASMYLRSACNCVRLERMRRQLWVYSNILYIRAPVVCSSSTVIRRRYYQCTVPKNRSPVCFFLPRHSFLRFNGHEARWSG